jgi:hypothetical protein
VFFTVSIAMNNTMHKASSIGLWSNAAEHRASKQPAVKPLGVTLLPTGDQRPTLRILSSRSAPKQANVAVQHRGWWYYVDDTDLASKRAFLQIQTLFLTRLTEATRGAQGAPLLTIPVK